MISHSHNIPAGHLRPSNSKKRALSPSVSNSKSDTFTQKRCSVLKRKRELDQTTLETEQLSSRLVKSTPLPALGMYLT